MRPTVKHMMALPQEPTTWESVTSSPSTERRPDEGRSAAEPEMQRARIHGLENGPKRRKGRN